MSTSLDWTEISLRLALTVVAGALVGINRGEHGRPAGLRTTLLVCLAASIAMILANLLLAGMERSPNSVVSLDFMRLPLGVLTGMGFIGGGVILKRGDLILGVTTAATLWFVTVVGLCFGAGQLLLGTVAVIIGLVVLWGLQYLEMKLPRDRRVTLTLTVGAGGPDPEALLELLRRERCRVTSIGWIYDREGDNQQIQCELIDRRPPGEIFLPAFLKSLSERPGVSRINWGPEGQIRGTV